MRGGRLHMRMSESAEFGYELVTRQPDKEDNNETID